MKTSLHGSMHIYKTEAMPFAHFKRRGTADSLTLFVKLLLVKSFKND